MYKAGRDFGLFFYLIAIHFMGKSIVFYCPGINDIPRLIFTLF
jgi:hypothetical protein